MKAATSTSVDRLLETKEYRIVSAPLMRHVIATSTLSDGAKVLWFSLWELCALEHERRRKLTLGFLAKRLAKSIDTIRRYVNQLQQAGYLVIEEKHDDKRRQLPSLYQPTAPTEIVLEIQRGFPDRKTNRSVDVTANRDVQTISQKTSESITSTAGYTLNEKAMPPKHCVDAIQKSNEVRRTCTQPARPSLNNESLVDVASTGKNGLSVPAKGISKLTQKIMLMQQRAVANSAGNNKAKPDSQNGNLMSKNTIAKGGEAGKSASERGSKSATQESIPKEDNNKTTSEPGGLRFWIYRQIKERKAFNSDPWRYVDEIAVAIEKGSLAKFNLSKAINIALKLIREGRWTAPRFVI